ncbi:MAG: M1 family metallopeptidase [Mariniblastus sp.]|nr:M1 family metallopeptidase [Mariniblastus sp.]
MHACRLLFLMLFLNSVPSAVFAQTDTTVSDQRAVELRGTVTAERAWWDLQRYDLKIEVDPEARTIEGTNEITFIPVSPGRRLQIDLQAPLQIEWVKVGERELKFVREGNAYFVEFDNDLKVGTASSIIVKYGGQPIVAENPPWSGGVSWQKDIKGNHFIATSCQGIGASVWWPNKDHGYDEPDRGMSIQVTVPEDLVAVSNGRLKQKLHDQKNQTRTFLWEVTNPINNYGVNMNIGNYVNFSETFSGEGGNLDVDYWVLDHQRETAQKHFKEAPRTLRAFEHWFGPYPFYEDSYKLVVVPYLGMEHQSSVTYGNGFKNGYRGRDLSATGVGLKFDFIIVHESGHEWFGNNISMKDGADMWIHESFTNYSENLFVEYHFTEKEAQDYVLGCRKLVKNDQPIIGEYNVNGRGSSGDMYYKGGNMLHSIRHTINDDKKWRSILRGLNKKFRHQTVGTKKIESYISQESGIDFGLFFDQYLRTTKIPVLRYQIDGNRLEYQYQNVVPGYDYPLRVRINGEVVSIKPTEGMQELRRNEAIKTFEVDRNFFIDSKAR